MMKSKNIQLALVTALLASCNRMVVPQMQPEGPAADTALTAKPEYADTAYSDSSCTCNSNRYYPSTQDALSPYGGPYYTGPVNSIYYNGIFYRHKAVWRGGKYIVRSGFGKSAQSPSS